MPSSGVRLRVSACVVCGKEMDRQTGRARDIWSLSGGRWAPAGRVIYTSLEWLDVCVCEEAEHVLGEDMDSGSCVLGPWKFRPRILLGQDHTNVMVTWAALEAKLYGNSTCIHLS
jgi:hypothetical protein